MIDPHAFVDVAAVADVPATAGLRVRRAGHEVALFRTGDTLVAYDGACPHRGAPLGDACVEDGVLSCPLHGWRFRVADGGCLDRPDRPLRPLPIRISGSRVLVALPPSFPSANPSP